MAGMRFPAPTRGTRHSAHTSTSQPSRAPTAALSSHSPRRLRTIGVGRVAFASLVALGAAHGCGAGGDTGPGVTTEQPGNAPGGSSPAAGGTFGDAQPIAGDCQGLTCGLDTSDQGPAPTGCGDGVLDSDEACDDGNLVSGDGCGANCLIAEPGFSCAVPGEACRQIARCGDGLVAPTEPCDDGNTVGGDGCSERCRVEFGKKCEGQPSVCTDAVCGNGIQEGAEACDDGNTTPFDGCSPICLREPNCQGLSCTSDCGDGLLINEECDDGNLIDGDGCSSSCTREEGFTCVAERACEQGVNGECLLRVPAIFRDFSGAHPDFTDVPSAQCPDLVLGVVAPQLDANGRPQLSGSDQARNAACIESPQSFAQWYTDSASSVSLVGELVLYDNGNGGYVNRYGAQGEPFATIDPQTETGTGAGTLAGCQQSCVQRARDAQQPFNGLGQLRCDDDCRPLFDQAQQRRNGQLNQLNNQLQQAQNQNPPDADAIAAIEAAIEAEQAVIAGLDENAQTCVTECEAALAERAATCSVTCQPCSTNPGQFCIGGETITFDGSPLFFPVDSITQGPTANFSPAKIPDQYGYNAFPFEEDVFPGAPDHNFSFTSEVEYWFQYEADTNATLSFLGDDDLWVFLNGRLAVDLGGKHVPSFGELTIDAAAGTITSTAQDGREGGAPPQNAQATTADFGLQPGNVYTISIFHAERQVEGSSFQLTLAGFEATPSECTAICGDNILSFGEECDDGVNDGGYNECAEGCVLGPFCGDGIRQAEFGEECDVGPGGDGACRGCRNFIIQ